MPSTEPPKNYEQFALRAIPLLQSAEAELRGAGEERQGYTASLDAVHSRLSRMDVRVDAIVKHFNIQVSGRDSRAGREGMNGHAPLNGSGHGGDDDDGNGNDSRRHPSRHDDAYDPDEEVTVNGRKVPVFDNKVALTKSDFEMLKSSAKLARIGMGIGEKVLIAAGAAIVLSLASLTGAWVHAAYVEARGVRTVPTAFVVTSAPAAAATATGSAAK